MLLRKIKNLVKKLARPKNLKIFLMVLVLLGIAAAIYIQTAHPALAQAPADQPSLLNPMTWIPLAIGVMVQLGITLVGSLLGVIIDILIQYVIFYNDFIYTSIVMTGWEIVRDVANMFFVLILLFVAIATILSIENYSLKRFLPRIVLMAILINFSKVIAGIIIDFAQIVTWTFASVISDSGIQNIYFSFGLQNLFGIAQVTNVTAITDWQIVAGLILGFILLLIAFIIILVYTLILILRIVALWILIILSPLAYLLSAWPGGKLQSYSRQWWEEFSKYVIVAPVLLFFLWLALTASGTDIRLNVPNAGIPGAPSAAITKIGSIQDLIRFIVTACLLIVGLSAAQKSGVAGAGYASSWMGRMRGVAQGLGRRAERFGGALLMGPKGLGKGAKTAAFWAGRHLDVLQMGVQKRILQKTRLGHWITGGTKEEERIKLREEEWGKARARGELEIASIKAEKEKELLPIQTAREKEIEERSGTTQEKLDRRRSFIEDRYKTGFLSKEQHEKAMAKFQEGQDKFDTIKSQVIEEFKPKEAEIERKYQAKEQEIQATQATQKAAIYEKYKYERLWPRRFFSRVAETGLTGNYRMWREGYKNFSRDRVGEYETGKGGTVHDVLGILTPLGKEKTLENFREERSNISEQERKIQDKTGGETDQAMEEFMDAVKNKDYYKTAGALMVTLKNVDANEFFKGSMREKIKPYLQDALREWVGKDQTFIDKDGNKKTRPVTESDVQSMMKSWEEKGEVQPGYLQAVLRHIFTKKMGVSEDRVARLMKQASSISLQQGQPWLYGSEVYDASRQKMAFQPLEIHEDVRGNLIVDVNEETKNTITGKIANQKRRNFLYGLHPGTLGTEDSNGLIKGLSSVGKEILLKNIDDAVLKAIRDRGYELRSDFYSKLLSSEDWQNEVRALAKDVKENFEKYSKYFKKKDLADEQARRINQLVDDMIKGAQTQETGKKEEKKEKKGKKETPPLEPEEEEEEPEEDTTLED